MIVFSLGRCFYVLTSAHAVTSRVSFKEFDCTICMKSVVAYKLLTALS